MNYTEKGQERALRPVLLKASFALMERRARLRLQAEGANIITTVVHETRSLPRAIDFLADEVSEDIRAGNGETLSIVVRCEGTIIASGIYEVDLAAAERIGALLIPCASHNLLLSQYLDDMCVTQHDTAPDLAAVRLEVAQ